MLSKKFLFALIGIILAFFALCNMNFGQPVVEGFWSNQYGTKMVPSVRLPNGQVTAAGGNYLDVNALTSTKFVSVPSYQAMLSPRFSNLNYGADIKYSMPDRDKMAVPCNPLTYGDMAQENFTPSPQGTVVGSKENYGGCASCGSSCSGGCPPSCGKGGYGMGHRVAGGYELPADYHTGNWKEVRDEIEPVGINMDGQLPVGTMATVNGAGEVEQAVFFNNLVFTARPISRLGAQGDPIRGDLPIVPCQSGWFSVYPNISTDLRAGAMQVMNGEGATNNATLSLLASASGRNTFGGVDLAETMTPYTANMAAQSTTNLSANLSDVNVTMFP